MRQRITSFPGSSIWPSRVWIALLVMTVLLVSCPGGSGGGYCSAAQLSVRTTSPEARITPSSNSAWTRPPRNCCS